ncbi:MAG TPA: hypothetical protein VGM90_16425, partial [Kofleriaceae bacterium]
DDAALADAGPFVGGSGTAAVTGCQGQPFNSVGAAYVVEHGHTTGQPEILLFDKPVECGPAGITTLGWDTDNALLGPLLPMQWIGIQLSAAASGTYSFTFVSPPAVGQAFATYYELHDTGSQACISQMNGTTTATLNASGTIDLSFSLMFAASPAISTGSVTAVPCAGSYASHRND